nr:putative ribonuclease H-like domain-containing protein [Tanacetum cinerariifolium]
MLLFVHLRVTDTSLLDANTIENSIPNSYTQEEGIDNDELFAHVARIEAIRLFLVYASFMGFMMYQMDVNSDFIYGRIEEEVYMCQPLGFEDSDHPDKVYKVVKALYGLYQAPRAWYETLAKYLLENRFHRGKIDQTLFIKRQNRDILLVQVCVDDIIFGSTKEELCNEFERLMKDNFQISSMGELTFFLKLQVKQKEDRIFISQDKYVTKVLGKFNLSDVKTASTLVDTKKPLVKDADDVDVDVHLYRSMIGLLMYITASRLDIIDSSFELVAYTNSDYARASLDRKSTTRGCQFLGSRLISWQCKKQTVVATSTTEAEYMAAANTREVQITIIIDGKIKLVFKASIRRHLKLEDFDGISTLPNTEIFEQLALMGVHTLKSDEGRMQQKEFMDLVTKLTDKVLALETDLQQTKKVYSTAFTKLIMKVKKLKKTVKSTKARRRAKIVMSDDEDAAEDTSKQGRKIDAIDQDPDISLVQYVAKVQGRHEQEIKFKTEDISTVETLVYIRRSTSKDKGKGIMTEFKPEQTITKLQQRQEISGYEAATRLQEQLDEEERQRIARVHEEASSFNINEWVNTFTPMESDVDRTISKIADESSKRAAEEELEQESSRRQKTRESLKLREKEDDNLTQENLQQTMMIVQVEEVYAEALQLVEETTAGED